MTNQKRARSCGARAESSCSWRRSSIDVDATLGAPSRRNSSVVHRRDARRARSLAPPRIRRPVVSALTATRWSRSSPPSSASASSSSLASPSFADAAAMPGGGDGSSNPPLARRIRPHHRSPSPRVPSPTRRNRRSVRRVAPSFTASPSSFAFAFAFGDPVPSTISDTDLPLDAPPLAPRTETPTSGTPAAVTARRS